MGVSVLLVASTENADTVPAVKLTAYAKRPLGVTATETGAALAMVPVFRRLPVTRSTRKVEIVSSWLPTMATRATSIGGGGGGAGVGGCAALLLPQAVVRSNRNAAMNAPREICSRDLRIAVLPFCRVVVNLRPIARGRSRSMAEFLIAE